MANNNLELPNQPKLAPGQEPDAAGQLGSDQAEARNGEAMANGSQGDTLEQNQDMARIAKTASAEPAPDGQNAPSGMSAATASLLQKAEGAIPTPAFLLGLIWINIHVFGHSVLGEKIFCELGEEWIPQNLRTGVYAESFKSKVKALGLLEKILLIIADVIALAALLALLAIIISLVRTMIVII